MAIETDRLVIRGFRADDAEPLRQMIVRYQASEYAAYDHRWPTSPEEVKGVAEWFASGDSFLAVCLKATGTLIGFVALNGGEGEAGKELNLGYCFDADYHGKGYATEACRAALSRAFSTLGAARVVTGTAAANTPSCRLLARLGMSKTGEATGSFQQSEDGTPIDFLGYSFALSREEWARQGSGDAGAAP